MTAIRQANSGHGDNQTKVFTSATVELKPNQTKQLSVGSYTKTNPKPEFDISASPDIDDQLGASFEKVDIPGGHRYIAFYHLHNFSDKICNVTISIRNIKGN